MKKSIFIGFMILLLSAGAQAAWVGTTADPFRIGIGARSMALGGVYAAVTDGSHNMFNNPAGMASQRNLHLSSMSTTLLGDVNYVVAGVNNESCFVSLSLRVVRRPRV